jgi:predicted O-linked N-acetylglucosamine transferase (SPINDLY family)
MKQRQYQKCIEACIECATECNHCAVACLEEKDVQYLTKCIRLDLECAIICRASAEVMTLGSSYSRQMCDLCATICNACAEMCEEHANMGMEHCRECAEACRACAKELMEVYQNLEQEDSETKTAIVHQDECAILSRAASELMSLDSAYCKEITALTASVCKAASETLETNLNQEMAHSRHRALISNDVQQHLQNEEQHLKKADENGPEENKEQPEQQKEVIKKKKKHSSALLAASMWRSPVSRLLPQVSHDVRGHSELANTGPFVNYDD